MSAQRKRKYPYKYVPPVKVTCYCNQCKGDRQVCRTTRWEHSGTYGTWAGAPESIQDESIPIVDDYVPDDVMSVTESSDSDEGITNAQADIQGNECLPKSRTHDDEFESLNLRTLFKADMIYLAQSVVAAHLKGVPQSTLEGLLSAFAETLNPYLPCIGDACIPETWYKVKKMAGIKDELENTRHTVVECARCHTLTRCSVSRLEIQRYTISMS